MKTKLLPTIGIITVFLIVACGESIIEVILL